MLSRHFIILLIILLPTRALCDYDTKKIKTEISHHAVFKVSEWNKSDNKQNWIASTRLKHVTISIGDKESKFIAPYFNPGQMKAAKTLCTEFATIALIPKNKQEIKKITSTIRKATTRHHLQFITMNNVKLFEHRLFSD